ncbi:MAG TPA: transglutaminase family protein [Xanthobacteraceae bacterium]|nr:transglutaminase family protein [Xanthobacteraceae bacterium]
MRIRVVHRTTYHYDTPATGVIQMLRLTPRNHDGQYVINWHIDVSADCRLDQHEDAFGNLCHAFTAEGPFNELVVSVEGEVETRDTGGVVSGAVERFPPSLFLRETPLTKPDQGIAAFAAAARAAAGDDSLKLLHELLAGLHRDITFDPDPTHSATTAAEAFALKRGVCQDLTHIFIAAARSIGIPARYISGHFHRNDGVIDQDAGHAWAEGFVPNLGWVAFDPANGICATDAHVRIAAGLDYLSAAPVRGTRYGGSGETLSVSVHVDQTQRQSQS